MAFRKLPKVITRVGDLPATITIGCNKNTRGHSRTAYLAISGKARRMLGDPAAIVLEWDEDAWLLRIRVAAVDDPDAYGIGKTPRIGITPIARELGWMWGIPVTVEVTQETRISIIADLSEVRTSSANGPEVAR